MPKSSTSWAPGVSGNPNGRPPKPSLSEVAANLPDVVIGQQHPDMARPLTMQEQVACTIASAVQNGEPWACELAAKYLFRPPPTEVEMTDNTERSDPFDGLTAKQLRSAIASLAIDDGSGAKRRNGNGKANGAAKSAKGAGAKKPA